MNEHYYDKNNMNEYVSTEKLKENIKKFYSIYKQRPIKNNNGGMKSAHMFPVWYLLKEIKPVFIIESGVWQGLGTWLFEVASPESKIISIDPNPQVRKYTSKKSKYLTEDFLNLKWDHIDPKNTLLFLDDHQNSIERIKFAKSIGIKKIIVEDNYPPNRGDCYSPKKVFSQKKFIIEKNGLKNVFEPNLDDYMFLTQNLFFYQEFPPLFNDETTRWGDPWDSKFYETKAPLLDNNQATLFPEFYEERRDYTWLCYLELI